MRRRDGVSGQRDGSADLPVFGGPPTVPGAIGLAGLSCEMLRCTRTVSKESAMVTVNILHMAVDLDSAAAELAKMCAFMTNLGFEVVQERSPDIFLKNGELHSPAVDVLVLGADKIPPASLDDVLGICVYDYGLVSGWDLLLYGTDNEVFPKGIPYERPFYSGPSFGSIGTCILRSHLRLRTDPRFWDGFFAHMGIEVESFIDCVLGQNRHKLYKKNRVHRAEVRD